MTMGWGRRWKIAAFPPHTLAKQALREGARRDQQDREAQTCPNSCPIQTSVSSVPPIFRRIRLPASHDQSLEIPRAVSIWKRTVGTRERGSTRIFLFYL